MRFLRCLAVALMLGGVSQAAATPLTDAVTLINQIPLGAMYAGASTSCQSACSTAYANIISTPLPWSWQKVIATVGFLESVNGACRNSSLWPTFNAALNTIDTLIPDSEFQIALTASPIDPATGLPTCLPSNFSPVTTGGNQPVPPPSTGGGSTSGGTTSSDESCPCPDGLPSSSCQKARCEISAYGTYTTKRCLDNVAMCASNPMEDERHSSYPDCKASPSGSGCLSESPAPVPVEARSATSCRLCQVAVTTINPDGSTANTTTTHCETANDPRIMATPIDGGKCRWVKAKDGYEIKNECGKRENDFCPGSCSSFRTRWDSNTGGCSRYGSATNTLPCDEMDPS